jgi:hypothetical protein
MRECEGERERERGRERGGEGERERERWREREGERGCEGESAVRRVEQLRVVAHLGAEGDEGRPLSGWGGVRRAVMGGHSCESLRYVWYGADRKMTLERWTNP